MDSGGLGCLADVGVAGWSWTEGEGLAMRRGLRWALGSLTDLEGLHHVNDAFHSLNNVIGFVQVGLQLQIGSGGSDGCRRDLHNDHREVTAASVVEVAMKEPKQISMGSTRMYAMLAGKTTLDRATMLQSEFPITPTWRANCQGVRLGQIR
jgi:hypothetical protein